MTLPFLIAPARAESRRIPYDPSKCATDAHDMVYFAVGRLVFRQPEWNLRYIAGGSKEYLAALPKPPQPDEPEGCPGHPIQGGAFDIFPWSAPPGEAANAATAYADSLYLIVNDGNRPTSENGLFALVCKSYGLRDNGVAGFDGCKKPFHCDEDVAYQTTEYEAPVGGKVALFCRVAADCSGIPSVCDGGYQIKKNFVVNFSFRTARLPIVQFIAADRELRRRIDLSEITDFKWADDHQGTAQ